MKPICHVRPYTLLHISTDTNMPASSGNTSCFGNILWSIMLILCCIAGIVFLFYYVHPEIALVVSIAVSAILFSLYIRGRVRGLYRHQEIVQEYQRPLVDLQQQVNRLECLCSISDITDEPGNTLDTFLHRIATRIPSAFEKPDTTGVRITVHSAVYKSDTFMLIPNLMSIPLKKHGETIGKIEVCRMQVPAGEECFSESEKDFIADVAMHVQRVVDRFEAVEHLIRYQSELKEKHQALIEKNRALHELVEQVEFEKKKIKEDIVVNVEKLILPSLKKLLQRSAPLDEKYLTLIERDLHGLLSSFGVKLHNLDDKLAPREIEICDMIRNGLPTKEISELLDISPTTVDRHRNNIRKKLGLVNNNVNLSTYLQSLV